MVNSDKPQAPSAGVLARLALLGAVVGVPAAFAAAMLLYVVHEATHWVWVDLPEALGEPAAPWYLVIGLPVLGAAIVAFARTQLPGNGGHQPIEGLAMDATPL